jgi:pyruvate,water dikinase
LGAGDEAAAAIVTNRGGRTCHAAIIARELGIPAVVGCGDATAVLTEGAKVTVSCAEGDTGNVYSGILDVEIADVAYRPHALDPDEDHAERRNPSLRSSSPIAERRRGPREARVHHQQERRHPSEGAARPRQPARRSAEEIRNRIGGYSSPTEFYVAKITEGVATIAAAFWPKKVIVRLSDFKSNEYSNLVGGQRFEPHEENPMLGFRGASRYIAPEFQDCFALECQAIRRIRDDMGLTNVEVMIPFVRTLARRSR